MTEPDFWRIIDETRPDATRNTDAADSHAANLTARLAPLPIDQIVAFQGWFEYLIKRAFTGLTHAAHMLITDGAGSDDQFLYFRTWLIGRGEALYKRALANPDVLADHLYDGDDPVIQTNGERLRYAATYVCQDKTGLDDTDDAWPLSHDALEQLVATHKADAPPSPDDDWIAEADVPRRLPKLAARCEVLWKNAPWRPKE
jgi:hypothetical protein